MTLLRVTGLRYRVEDRVILEDVSLQLPRTPYRLPDG